MTLAVSVVIPTYKGEPFLTETVRSIVEQTCPPREIIVVDDHSPDGTCALVTRLAGHSRIPIHLIRLEKNSGGPAHPLNVGLERATSDFVALMDHDDVMLPDKLELQTRCFERDPDLVLVFGNFMDLVEDCVDGSGMATPTLDQLRAMAEQRGDYWRMSSESMTQMQLLNPGVIQSCSNLVFPRRLWLEGIRFDPSRTVIADFLFKIKATQQGPVGFVPRPLFKKRVHANNLYQRDPADNCWQVYQAVLATVTENPRLLDNKAFRTTLREMLLAQAWARRRHGKVLEALELYWRCLRVFGFSWRICSQFARLPLGLVRR